MPQAESLAHSATEVNPEFAGHPTTGRRRRHRLTRCGDRAARLRPILRRSPIELHPVGKPLPAPSGPPAAGAEWQHCRAVRGSVASRRLATVGCLCLAPSGPVQLCHPISGGRHELCADGRTTLAPLSVPHSAPFGPPLWTVAARPHDKRESKPSWQIRFDGTGTGRSYFRACGGERRTDPAHRDTDRQIGPDVVPSRAKGETPNAARPSSRPGNAPNAVGGDGQSRIAEVRLGARQVREVPSQRCESPS